MVGGRFGTHKVFDGLLQTMATQDEQLPKTIEVLLRPPTKFATSDFLNLSLHAVTRLMEECPEDLTDDLQRYFDL